ncbi:MAG: aldo/keto reductase [Flavobacteriaceae bacterium]|jgi:aryl-alcohol dehydrogenase-like predicted oxidoreductase|nr:aldo/keto reductase [Flavobacteriaceae bacterium]MCP4801935.1 aldo/keto reductase [Bacteroidota bacterium]MDG1378529.1 aldo/keto reductase [Flavobacteriaceae bacterium]MDG2350626.1 aldo/keto reductase [Flavobacteriaceae bacterium]|tara:strand:+ start:141 stop:1184 length:1044 start_codon:yes stop_codon:yes gene_type:complete
MKRIEIRPGYSISKVIKGGWHLAGGHGIIDQNKALEDMYQFVKAGITTFDCADIYTGVEELIGKFRKKYQDEFQSGELAPIQIHTKYVPDYSSLATLKKEDTVKIIDRSLRRLNVEQLDLVQFAWWDYQFPRYLETAVHLSELQKSGKIRHLGVTNFDTVRIKEMLNAGVEITTNQVQYSLLDRRVENSMSDLAQEHNIPYLCYGSIAGGFLSDRYLGTSDPTQPYENRSLTKYRLIIDEFGGYNLFQELLKVLRTIADKYHVGVAEIASKYVLQKPMVASVIIGARNNKHLNNLKKLDYFNLNNDDLEAISKIIDISKGPYGPFYELERDKTGKHGSIMKYNLNES